jgi:hypothetical protein
MEDRDGRLRWHRRVHRFNMGALVFWLSAVALDIAMFGGFESLVSVISAAVTTSVIVAGIVSARMALREDAGGR